MSAIRPVADDLRDQSRYALLDEVVHEDLVSAMNRYLKQPSPVRIAYRVVSGLTALALVVVWVKTGTPLLATFPRFCMALCLGYVVLAPIHEWIHALTYRWLGARTTKVVYNWRTLSAYCVADRFVVTGREFVWVALMPFLVINSVLAAGIIAAGGVSVTLWGLFLFHVAACSGDVAFVNLVWHHRGEKFLTYDDVANKKSYFYVTRVAADAPAS